MGDLREESREQRFPYVFVEFCLVLGIRGAGYNADVVAFHDPLEL